MGLLFFIFLRFMFYGQSVFQKPLGFSIACLVPKQIGLSSFVYFVYFFARGSASAKGRIVPIHIHLVFLMFEAVSESCARGP